MANTIKLKRGSGSDPGTSDLVVGEVAVRTDNGKLFTKKDDGTIAEISGSGGGGISDGDKGDITVSNSGGTFTIDNGVVTSAKIADGTIVNADISGSAAIEGSKIQAAGLVNAGVMTAAQHNKLAGIEANATADMTGSEILSTISGENIILGEISSTGNSTFAGNMTISSSDGGSAAAPELDLYRISASPADADYLGQIKFSGESDDDSKEVYAKITGKIGDASSGTEDGIIEIAHRKAGSNNISARFTSEDLKLINGTGLEVAGDITASSNLTGVKSIQATGYAALTSTPHTYKYGRGSEAGGLSQYATESAIELVGLDSSNHGASFLLRTNVDGAGFIYNPTDNALELKLFTTSANDFSLHGSGSNVSHIETQLRVVRDAQVELAHNGTVRLATSSSGATITGNLAVTGTVDGRDLATDGTKLDGIETGATADQTASEIVALIADQTIAPSTIDMEDDEKIKLGNSDDLEIYHDSNNSYVQDTGTGNLVLKGTQVVIQSGGSNKSKAIFRDNGASELYHGISSSESSAQLKIATTTTGVSVTGNIAVSGTVDGRDLATDGTKLDGIESNATADQTASEILSLLSDQNITTTGTLNSKDITLTDTTPSIFFVDSSANPDYEIQNANGVLKIRDTTNSATRFAVATDGHIDIAGNLDCASGVDVTGNITVSGTVDGRDLATDGSKLDGIESGATADQTKSDIDALGIAASTATTLATARTIAGVSFDGSANISLNNNAITNGAGYITSSDSSITDKLPLAGGTLTGNLFISNSSPSLTLTDSNNNPDYQIGNADGTLRFRDTGAAANRMTITSSAVDINVNLDANAGLDVTGNAAVSGSVTAPRISGSNGIVEMKAEIGTSQTLTSGYNAIAVDPTIANGVTITVPSGAIWSIV